MKKIHYILIILVGFILVQCQTTSNKSNDAEIESETIIYFENDIELSGTGESGIASFYLDWNIQIINNDSIIMLSTLKRDKNDIRLNNRQYYGRLRKSEKYSYEILISDFFATDGCNKPSNQYLGTDTIPFYIDSTLLSSVGYWKLIINNENDTFKINEALFLYKTDIKDFETDIIMSLIPNEKSGLYPVTIKSGLRCGVYLTNRISSIKYFLNENGEKYELIIDNTIQSGMVGKDCDFCIKSIELEKK